jgi:hypothetical protein
MQAGKTKGKSGKGVAGKSGKGGSGNKTVGVRRAMPAGRGNFDAPRVGRLTSAPRRRPPSLPSCRCRSRCHRLFSPMQRDAPLTGGWCGAARTSGDGPCRAGGIFRGAEEGDGSRDAGERSAAPPSTRDACILARTHAPCLRQAEDRVQTLARRVKKRQSEIDAAVNNGTIHCTSQQLLGQVRHPRPSALTRPLRLVGVVTDRVVPSAALCICSAPRAPSSTAASASRRTSAS